MSKKLLAILASAIGLAMSAPASAIVIGGVDFGPSADRHIETTTLAETLVTGNGDELRGYGRVNTVNDIVDYANGNKLFFVFDSYIANDFTPTSVDFTGGEVRVYLGPDFIQLDQSSAANIALIESYTPWLTLTGHGLNGTADTLTANGSLTGAALAFFGSGLLDVNEGGPGLASVIAALNGNSEADGAGGFADILITTSGANNPNRLNRNDDLSGCFDGTATSDQFCIAGSADLSGSIVQVPEPGVLGMLGIGALALGAVTRRRKDS